MLRVHYKNSTIICCTSPMASVKLKRQMKKSIKKVGDTWDKTISDSKKAKSRLLTEWEIKGASQGEAVQIANRIKLLDEMLRLWEKCEPVAMGYEGGGPMIPAEAQQYEDLFAGFQNAKVKAPIVKTAFERLKKELQQKLSDMRKKN